MISRIMFQHLLLFTIALTLTHHVSSKQIHTNDQEQIQSSTTNDHITTKNDSLSFKQIHNHLLVGYDCSNPTNISSHEFDSIEKCEEDASQVF